MSYEDEPRPQECWFCRSRVATTQDAYGIWWCDYHARSSRA